MAQFIKLETPTGLQRGGTTTLPIIIGPYYRHLELLLTSSSGAETAATPTTITQFAGMVREMRVKINGNTIQQISGSALLRMNAYFGPKYEAITGAFPLWFTRLWMLTEGGQDSSRLASFGARSCTLEIDWEDSGQYPRSADIRAQQENRLSPEDIGGYRKITQFSKSYSGIGRDEIIDLPRGDHLCHLIMIDHPLQNVIDNINRVQLVINQSVQYETLPLNRDLAMKRLGRVEQEKCLMIDFADKQLFGEALPMDATDLRLIIDWDVAPDAYTIYLDETRAEELTRG